MARSGTGSGASVFVPSVDQTELEKGRGRTTRRRWRSEKMITALQTRPQKTLYGRKLPAPHWWVDRKLVTIWRVTSSTELKVLAAWQDLNSRFIKASQISCLLAYTQIQINIPGGLGTLLLLIQRVVGLETASDLCHLVLPPIAVNCCIHLKSCMKWKCYKAPLLAVALLV